MTDQLYWYAKIELARRWKGVSRHKREEAIEGYRHLAACSKKHHRQQAWEAGPWIMCEEA
jgi:hypothetical protein